MLITNINRFYKSTLTCQNLIAYMLGTLDETNIQLMLIAILGYLNIKEIKYVSEDDYINIAKNVENS